MEIINEKEIPLQPGTTLVLTTRIYPSENIPVVEGRTCIMPSEPVSMTKWDYTNPKGLQDAFEPGWRDRDVFVTSLTHSQ